MDSLKTSCAETVRLSRASLMEARCTSARCSAPLDGIDCGSELLMYDDRLAPASVGVFFESSIGREKSGA